MSVNANVVAIRPYVARYRWIKQGSSKDQIYCDANGQPVNRPVAIGSKDGKQVYDPPQQSQWCADYLAYDGSGSRWRIVKLIPAKNDDPSVRIYRIDDGRLTLMVEMNNKKSTNEAVTVDNTGTGATTSGALAQDQATNAPSPSKSNEKKKPVIDLSKLFKPR